MEIWTRSRIHVTAAFLSSPQTAHRHRMLGLYSSALLYIKKRLTYYYVCITRIMVLLAYTHTEKAYFNGKTTNIDTKALL